MTQPLSKRRTQDRDDCMQEKTLKPWRAMHLEKRFPQDLLLLAYQAAPGLHVRINPMPMTRILLITLALATSAHVNASDAVTCSTLAEQDALGLFDRWNDALQTGQAELVADLYSDNAVLLPTLSATPRLTREERVDYFQHFLANRPSGTLDTHVLQPGCNTATLTGIYTFDMATDATQVQARYTFTYQRYAGAWLIAHQHSSLMP